MEDHGEPHGGHTPAFAGRSVVPILTIVKPKIRFKKRARAPQEEGACYLIIKDTEREGVAGGGVLPHNKSYRGKEKMEKGVAGARTVASQ